MSHSSVERLFTIFDKSARIIESELSITYLEALAVTAENIFYDEINEQDLSEITIKRLNKIYNDNNLEIDLQDQENVRKAFQLAILNGMKDHAQPNHQMTPDGVGLFVNYLVDKLLHDKNSFTILDLAVGTGNLLTTILNGQRDKEITAYGVEIDDLLLKLAFANANLQKHPIQFFNQDSLEPLFIDPVDITVTDLPVGYYPKDERAKQFAVHAKSGHTFAHHLFIEQAGHYVKEGGYLIFIIPNNLFETDQAEQLHEYIKENHIIQGLIQLPLSLFKDKSMAKSIFILQKKHTKLSPPKQVLLAELPDLSNSAAMQSIVNQINNWFKENK